MERNFVFDDELFDEELEGETEEELCEQEFCSEDIDFCLTEIDFYPPPDNRVWTSNIEDVDGGDNFADYCEYIFELLEDEGCYDN